MAGPAVTGNAKLARQIAHRAKMAMKQLRRQRLHAFAVEQGPPRGFVAAGINRRTGKPHEHVAEIARRG